MCDDAPIERSQQATASHYPGQESGVAASFIPLNFHSDPNTDQASSLRREAQANPKLAAASRRVEQRYELAVEAILTFHSGVSADFLLKEERFKAVPD